MNLIKFGFLILVLSVWENHAVDHGTDKNALMTLDVFKLDLETIGKVQIELAELLDNLLTRLEAEMRVERDLPKQSLDRLHKDLKEFIDDVRELQHRFLTLDFEDPPSILEERLNLGSYLEIFGSMVDMIEQYLVAGPHRSFMDRMKYNMMAIKQRVNSFFSNVGRKAKAIGLGMGFRTLGMEDDDDDPLEYSEIFYTAQHEKKIAETKRIRNQVILPLTFLYEDPDKSDKINAEDEALEKGDAKKEEGKELELMSGEDNTLADEGFSEESRKRPAQRTTDMGLSIRDGKLFISIPLSFLPTLQMQQEEPPKHQRAQDKEEYSNIAGDLPQIIHID